MFGRAHIHSHLVDTFFILYTHTYTYYLFLYTIFWRSILTDAPLVDNGTTVLSYRALVCTARNQWIRDCIHRMQLVEHLSQIDNWIIHCNLSKCESIRRDDNNPMLHKFNTQTKRKTQFNFTFFSTISLCAAILFPIQTRLQSICIRISINHSNQISIFEKPQFFNQNSALNVDEKHTTMLMNQWCMETHAQRVHSLVNICTSYTPKHLSFHKWTDNHISKSQIKPPKPTVWRKKKSSILYFVNEHDLIGWIPWEYAN